MGNIMLILTFIALIFVPDKTVSNIGVFSSLLVALSLIMELFVLPVLFLNLIKSNHQLKGYYHGN
jgi:predicted RND superfamily exporter protein